MPIAIQSANDAIRHNEEDFIDENELQSCLERNPYLVLDESEPQVAVVQREVGLPNAGNLDVLLIDQEGTPIAVEAKLARNGQSRREVVAQAFDYVSDLSQLTFDELDDLVGGNLSRALETLIPGTSCAEVRKQCGVNLRAGKVKLVVAVDRANDGLVRIVQYVNDHSDIDARLVAISKYNGGSILVPRLLVSGGSHAGTTCVDEKRQRQVTDPYFQQILSSHDSCADAQFKTRGMGNVWRTIRPDSWPQEIHYAFGFLEADTEVGLHIESATQETLIASAQKLAALGLPGEAGLEWSPRKKGGGYLWLSKPKTSDPATVARTMYALIEATREIVEKEKC